MAPATEGEFQTVMGRPSRFAFRSAGAGLSRRLHSPFFEYARANPPST